MTCEIEPEAAKIDSGNGDAERDTASLRSQAISLKRIADALDALTTAGASGPLQGEIWGFVSNLAWEAGRNFQAGTRTDR